MKSTCFQVRTILARSTSRSRSVSAQDDKLLTEKCVFCHEFGPALGKVTTVPNMREELDGLVQSTKRCWSDWRHMLVICLMKIRRPGTVYDSFLFEDE